MALPTTTISMSQVNTELGRSATASINLNESAVRTLAGVSSGAISMNNLRGKSASIFSCSLTEGFYSDGGSPATIKRGFCGSASTDPLFAFTLGSVSSSTINKPGGGTATFNEFAHRSVPVKGGSFTSLPFQVIGNHTGTWWTSITYNGTTFLRANAANPSGEYDATYNITIWSYLADYSSIFTSNGTVRTFTIS